MGFWLWPESIFHTKEKWSLLYEHEISIILKTWELMYSKIEV